MNRQLSRIINEDQETVLATAFEGYEEKLASYEIIVKVNTYAQKVKEYLNTVNNDDSYTPQLLNIESTQILLSEVIVELEKWRSQDPKEDLDRQRLNEEAGRILSLIYSKFNLKTGDRYLMDRIKAIVRWDIIAYAKW